MLQALDLPEQLKRLFLECRLRGRRLADIAAGDLLELLRSLFDVSCAKLFLALPNGLDASDRAMLLREFEAGRHHLFTEFVLKTAHFLEPPWCVFAMAHRVWNKARAAFRKVMASNCKHALVIEVQSEEAWLLWFDGTPIGEREERLLQFLAKLKLAPTNG